MNNETLPSWLLDIPAAEYHAAARRGEFLTSSGVAALLSSPLDYFHANANPPEETPAMAFGTACHKRILEGSDAFSDSYCVWYPPEASKASKEYKSAKAEAEAAAAGKTLMDSDTFGRVMGVYMAVQQNEDAREILDGILPEKTIRAEIDGVACQVRPDAVNVEKCVLADLKTTTRPREFYRKGRGGTPYGDALTRFYPQRLAFYTMVFCKAAFGAIPETADDFAGVWRVCFIVAGTEAPYVSAVWDVTPGVMAAAAAHVRAAIGKLNVCRDKGFWPSGLEGRNVIDEL